MTALFPPPADYARVRKVHSFEELLSTPFENGVNALWWERSLPGDFLELAETLAAATAPTVSSADARGQDEDEDCDCDNDDEEEEDHEELENSGIIPLDEELLARLSLSPAAREAARVMLNDQRLLREHGLLPELNCLHAYPRSAEEETVPTHVYSFHADSAPVEADTWLCTYHGASSEALRQEDALRLVIPAARLRPFARHLRPAGI